MSTPPDTDPAQDEESFFALMMARARAPFAVPETVVDYEDRDGPYRIRHRLVVETPDDDQVAALDGCRSALHELEVLADSLAGGDLDDLLDVLDARGWTVPATVDRMLVHFGLDDPPETGWGELVERINIYGRGLEYDLWERGHSLGAYFRGEAEGWDQLLRVAARLPPGSHYRSAQLADDELAARIGARYGPPSKRRQQGNGRPALEGFTTDVAYLHRIDNRLHYLAWAIFAAQSGKKSSPPKPAKGPETADDRYEFADFLREHDEVVGQVLKRKGGSAARAAAGGRTLAPEAVRGAVALTPPAAFGDADEAASPTPPALLPP